MNCGIIFARNSGKLRLRPTIPSQRLPRILLCWGIFFYATTMPGSAAAAGCLNNGCHQPLATPRHLHGPVAAEMAGAEGCTACHQPVGAACTPRTAGQFILPEKDMCLLCHGGQTGTEHTNSKDACLECHDPHGSDKSPYLLRKDR